MALRHWLQLALTENVGPITVRRLIDHAGSAEAACAASVADLQCIDGIGPAKSRALFAALQKAAGSAEHEARRAESLQLPLLCPDDPAYPPLLHAIPDPPPVLYVRGQLEPRDLNAMAIVGSRRCSYYGREQAERFAALLAGAGFTVVSGGARGVDSSAHRGALSHGQGRTIAVLGCGIDIVYPPENATLFDQIAQRGAILSEYPLATPPLQENFPRRNRIVSGISRGVLVVEADERSGALITARQAADDHNRPVFALPGRVDNPLSSGPHQLIRDGAVLVRHLEDILDGLDPMPHQVSQPSLFAGRDAPPEPSASTAAPAEKPPSPVGLTDRQQQLLSHLGGDPSTIDALIDRSGLDAPVVLQELTFLSLRGLARRVDGQTYIRTPAHA